MMQKMITNLYFFQKQVLVGGRIVLHTQYIFMLTLSCFFFDGHIQYFDNYLIIFFKTLIIFSPCKIRQKKVNILLLATTKGQKSFFQPLSHSKILIILFQIIYIYYIIYVFYLNFFINIALLIYYLHLINIVFIYFLSFILLFI